MPRFVAKRSCFKTEIKNSHTVLSYSQVNAVFAINSLKEAARKLGHYENI